MNLIKNETYEVEIQDLGINGEGIGRVDGFTVFVPGALPGERVLFLAVKVKKTYAYGKMLSCKKKSPHRVEAPCKVFGKCGGCTLQHLSYQAQLAWKEKCVKDALERIGGFHDIEVQPILGMDDPWRYRNKSQFPVGFDGTGGVVGGFYANRSHKIVSVEDCIISGSVHSAFLQIVLDFIKECHIPPYDEHAHEGILRHVAVRTAYHNNDWIGCLVINGDRLPNQNQLIERCKDLAGLKGLVLNINKNKTNVIFGGHTKLLWGQSYLADQLLDSTFHISMSSFYQVNPAQTEVLYRKVFELAGLTGRETVIDLYCGIGAMTLLGAKKAKQSIGVEIVPEAIENARENAVRNGIANVSFYLGAAEAVLPQITKENHLTGPVVILDPPRKGSDEITLQTIASIHPQKIIYVSCNPATLARDLAFLSKQGFQPGCVQPIDCFPMTSHVETAVLMSRKEG